MEGRATRRDKPRGLRSRCRWLPFAISIALLAAAGCEQEVDTTYAAIRGPSLNGVSAFVQLLRDTGHTVIARQHLPTEVDSEFETLVVFDDSFTGLDSTAAELLLEFLFADGPRTLLLVLRDSDGAIDYLRNVLARDDLSPDRRRRAEELRDACELALAKATSAPRVATFPFPDGLVTETRGPAAEAVAVRLRGGPGDSVEHVNARWELRRRLEPDREAAPLWTSGRERLLVRRRLHEASILVLTSAAPLLNGGLVDPGNRRLAEEVASLLPRRGRLLVTGSSQAVGDCGGAAASGRDGNDSAEGDEPSLWRLLRVQPLPWVAAQASVALALFCWCTAPIFGRPRQSSPALVQDFGHHVEALANLFDKAPAAGAAFARERLEAWQPTGTDTVRKGCRPPRR